jgi:hypothetical protein
MQLLVKQHWQAPVAFLALSATTTALQRMGSMMCGVAAEMMAEPSLGRHSRYI